MKSMLHEASTVIKAVEKAWIDSGKPLEFTVKVLEVGEKNFLGLSKRPAIVSIAYDPKKHVSKASDRREVVTHSHKGQQRLQSQGQRPRQQVLRQDQQPEERLRPEQQSFDKGPVQQRQRPVREMQSQVLQQEEHWTQDMIDDIKHWLGEMIAFLNIDSAYTARADKRMLSIVFDKQLLPTPDEERQLFVGLSYLVIQFLKKKHKKKLRGYHLVISTKEYATSDKAK